MSQKTFPVYDHPSYTSRQSVSLGSLGPTASAKAKWVLHANMYLFGANALYDTIGTSTYSSTVSSQQISYFAVLNTNTTGTAITLATTTWGPYNLGAFGTGTTGLAGVVLVTPLNTSAGLAGQGGYYLPQGAEFYAQNGTDATAISVVSVDYQLAPLAPVVA